MVFKTQEINCIRCGKSHALKIEIGLLMDSQKDEFDRITQKFLCPDIATMFRVLGFALDTRVNFFKSSLPEAEKNKQKVQFVQAWGEQNFEHKFQRYLDLDLTFLGIPEEYYNLLMDVVYSYCCGYFYPAMTSCGALGERIINRLILKTRDYFKGSPEYKLVHNKDTFDNWDKPLNILKNWNIISSEVHTAFMQLKKYRNDSIHYRLGYNFESNSHNAVKFLADIIKLQFDYSQRKDILWVFNVPGEIWVRSKSLNDPFVKEFVLPNSLQLSPYDEPTSDPPFQGTNSPLRPISDEDFIRLRNSRHKIK